MTGSTQPMFVLIPTAGRAELLERTLQSLVDVTDPGSLVEIVVVENGPKHDIEQRVEEYREKLPLRYMYVEEANKSVALNRAIDTLSDGLVVFLDDDVRLEPTVLIEYAAGAAKYGPGFYFGGPLPVDQETVPEKWLDDLLPSSARGWEMGSEEVVGVGPVFIGPNWGAFVQDIRRVGGFSRHFGPGSPARGQESEMMHRLERSGARSVYLPEARVWHFVPHERCTPNWLVQRSFAMGRGLGRLNRRAGRGRVVPTCLYLVHAAQSGAVWCVARIIGNETLQTTTAVRLRLRLGHLTGLWETPQSD